VGEAQSSWVQTQLWMEQLPSMGRGSLLCPGCSGKTNPADHKTIRQPPPASPAPPNLALTWAADRLLSFKITNYNNSNNLRYTPDVHFSPKRQRGTEERKKSQERS